MTQRLNAEQLGRAYRRMKTIREFEERLHVEIATGEIPGFTHLYAGQEAVAVGVCEHLADDDYIVSTHRGHGHCIAKGCDVNGMMLEIYGRSDGLCKGKGGSMHIADVERGMLGANAIVGGGPPLAVGAAIACRNRGQGKVSVAFGGDGSCNQGTVFEAMNMAVVLKVPAIFVIEDNGYSEHTGASYAVGSKDIAGRARARKLADFAALAASTDRPIKPERVVDSLNRHLPAGAIVVADPGTPCPYFSAYFDAPQAGRHFITNRAHGALGFAMSAGVGAWFGRPDATVVAAMGDGSFNFTCGELETIVRRRVPLKMIVFSNTVYGWIKASQKTGYGERYFSVDFNRTDHARVAEAFGVKSWRVEDPAGLDGAVKAALAHDGPALVDVISQQLQDTAVPVSQWMG